MRSIPLTSDDILIDTQKVTTGYFTGGLGTIAGSSLVTASLSAEQQKYYANLQYSSEDHFSITYGMSAGSGSTASSLNSGVGETEAVYKSYASYLLRTDDIEGGFKIYSDSVQDKDVYFIIAERAKMKDRINFGSWTLGLSGSNGNTGSAANSGKVGAWGAGTTLTLTDDSATTAPFSSPIGPRYNVYAGAAGVVSSTTTKYGWFWPDAGCIALSGTALSASLPGSTGWASGSGVFGNEGASTADGLQRGVGFHPNRNTGVKHYLKLASAIHLYSGNQQFRSEEDQTTVTYFCRALSREFNHSSNPTFVSGSEGLYREPSFEGNPQTFITTIGLYNNQEECVAVGRLSKALLKNYSTEAITKVKLTY